MKLTRRQKETAGLSMLISAGTLTVTFIILSCRKRSVPAALAALAAAETSAAYLLLTEPKPRKHKKGTEEELFSDEEYRAAGEHIRHVLGGRHDEEVAPRVLREIPRDEDATEADFQ
ncbi:MAG: hypothetical protein IJX39_06690 [Clostridia bacterium]|nr:hypothetical protein [Clostridia bacterium]